ncbi:hypothetical protein [Fimbriiglobus ruber]|uniref:Uncharacterized protein n=1 Tax=Fimbriiglobus ruber TaxID=1908690 RepID=A0A225DLQ1_9BACT|nr:hypothetical protein [Fimbriiglobus ruber]OWK41913.1 hypothetical protein FRUB_03991 [Fimbriiglobus ruber]
MCPRIAREFEGGRQAAYWKAQHGRAVERERCVSERIQDLEAQNRLRQQTIFGTSSEATVGAGTPAEGGPPVRRRSRGQQPGTPSPAKRTHDPLPAVDEVRDLPADPRQCGCCGRPFVAFPGTEDSTILEVEVKAHRRVIRRRRSRSGCSCPGNAPLVTAPPAPPGHS